MTELSAAERARIDSYMVDIAAAARGTPIADSSGSSWRFGGKGSLCVYVDGQYHDFASGGHGHGALQLIRHLYPNEDATQWARAWLARHSGAGSFVPGESDEPADDHAETEATAFVEALYSGAARIDGAAGLSYLNGPRGLPLKPEDAAQLRWIANYRGDEGALIAPAVDDAGKPARLLVIHVTADGLKSKHEPARVTIRGAKRPGLVRFGSPGPKAIETEGLEKGLAARASGAEYVVVSGGVANLGKAALHTIVRSVVIARDADPAGSPADQALWRGVVRRLGQGLKVAVTARPNDIAPKDAPPLKDLDDLYRYDPELVSVLLDGANLEHGRLGDAVDGAILDAASRLDAIELGRARKGIAGLLATGLSGLDDKLNEIVRKRVETSEGPGGDGLPGMPLTFDEIEPWHEQLNGAALLTELSDAIGKYVVMDAHQRDAVALWTVFSHTHDLRDFAPLLIARSAVKRSGKSRLAEVMERLAPRPLYIAGLTVSFVERVIQDHRPTLLIDEADRLRKGDAALAQRIDAQFNRSFSRRTARVGKNVPLPGGGYVPRLFSTWAPTLIAGIGKQADTAEDRAVIIALKRKLSSEKVKQLRAKDGANLVVLARKIARFVADNEVRLRTCAPAALEVDNDRAKDVWEPLLAIAETAGGDWPARARAAGKQLCGEYIEEEEEFKVRLLGDIRELFRAAFPPGHAVHAIPGGPRLSSTDIVNKLLVLDDRPYGAMGRRQSRLTPYELGRVLKEFKIRPGTVRLVNSDKTPKGYYLHQFEDAFAHYLSTPEGGTSEEATTPEKAASEEKSASVSFHPPISPPLDRHTRTSVEKPKENEGFASATENPCGGSKKPGNPSNSGPCAGVAEKSAGNVGVEKNTEVREALPTHFPRGPKGRKARTTPVDTTLGETP